MPTLPSSPRHPTVSGAPRRLVVVLGMHNSGTSLLARVISLMGVELGRNVLTRERLTVAPRYDYWEHAGITEIQDEILAAIGRYWNDGRADWPCPAELWRRPDVLALKRRLVDILEAELAENPGTWGFKDPRTVRLMPLWLDIFAALELDPLYLISVRAPTPVATSFAAKARVPFALAERLWTRHYFEALQHTEELPRLVVDYDNWFGHFQREFDRLADVLGLPHGAERTKARDAVAATIDPGLKQYGNAPDSRLQPITRDLYDVLSRMAESVDGSVDAAGILARAEELVTRHA